ncbi:LysR family transcriptional regulator (plasmid) [Cupriavidus sp. P-10]|uniref:LysR substrate-binding domain-containing protein n=1 Tax=Cupriavidus sp. P-10 TaxID=2027911 RepID=UPI000E2FD931|nr:LysR substrate-binding domain-containing protein [Cupriavidus sp. P-10]BDB29983.1 LysR family transcriptional regulator [Cupriavidus sp. P-10]
MELRQLRYFVAVVELGSLSKAADAVHISQSALSLQIARLEDELDTQLLSRSSRGVLPTEAGIEFCRRARAVLQQISQMKEKAPQSATGLRGTVTIGLPASVAQAISVEFIKRVKALYPAVTPCIFEYPSSYLAELLVNHRLDQALLFMEDLARGIEAIPLLIEDFYLVGIPVEDPSEAQALTLIQDHPMVMPALPNNVRTIVEDACRAAGIRPNIVAEGSNPQTLLRLVRAGVGGTVLPLSALLPTDIECTPAIHIDPPLCRKLALCRAVDVPQEPLQLAIRDLVVEVIDNLVARGDWPGVRRFAP